MRAILQEWKRGRAVRQLLPPARGIEDPSFAAEALFALATDPALGAEDSEKTALEALRFVDKVERDWRRGEALAEMGRRLPDLRKLGPEASLRASAGVVDRVLQLPAKPRSDAMRAIAPHLDAADLPRLLARALASEEDALETGKAILKAAVDAGAAQEVLPAIRDTLDAELRLRMMGAWASRAAAALPDESAKVLGETLQGVAALPDEALRIDVVRAIAASCDGLAPLHVVHLWAKGQPDEPAARILSALGARADRLGHRDAATLLLREAEARAQRIGDAKAKASVQRNVQEGLKRMGLADEAPTEVAAAPAQGVRVPAKPSPAAPAGAPRHVLALVDAYEGGLGEAHMRAVARAAPLCDAFGLDLALVGFPVKDLASFVKRAGRETNIGEGRGSLELLHRQGRLHIVPVEGGALPQAGLGQPVATTPNPDPAKATMEFPQGDRLMVLVGLGPKGLPEPMLRASAVHVEVTGRRVSLETATAMGVIAERLGRLR